MTQAEALYVLSVLRQLGIRVWDYHDNVCDRLFLAVHRVLSTTPDPSLLDIAEGYLSDCDCFTELSLSMVLEAVMHIWHNMDLQFDCTSIMGVYEYIMLEKVCPTDDQYSHFCENVRRMRHEPEDYYEEKRVIVPTENVAHLSITDCKNSDQQCGICLQEIPLGTAVYCLPPCCHVFHAEKKACLGNAGIKNWLEKSPKCPNCQGEVEIDLSGPKRRKIN